MSVNTERSIDRDLAAGFTNALKAIDKPDALYICHAVYRSPSGKQFRITDTVSGRSSCSALAGFVAEQDDENEGCTRISQGARPQ